MRNATRVYPTGESHHNSKLTDEQIQGILDLLKEGNLTQSEISRMYGISRGYVHNLSKGRRRKQQVKQD